jgi:hypothetical protein
MTRLINSRLFRAERKHRQAVYQERLQERFEDGDPSLRRTILGNVKIRRTGGIAIASAEGVRFYGTETPLPRGNVVQVAGRDPFTPDPNLPVEELFEQAKVCERERIELGLQLGLTDPELSGEH